MGVEMSRVLLRLHSTFERMATVKEFRCACFAQESAFPLLRVPAIQLLAEHSGSTSARLRQPCTPCSSTWPPCH